MPTDDEHRIAPRCECSTLGSMTVHDVDCPSIADHDWPILPVIRTSVL